MSKTKSKAVSVQVPQDDTEAREAIRKLGDHQREILRLETKMNDQIAKLQEEFGNMAAPLREQADDLHEGVKIFCEANRGRLTQGGKVKSHQFSTGSIAWRSLPAKVRLRKVDDVIAEIKAKRLGKKFLRTKEEVNKDALLAEQDLARTIPGVTIGSEGETFTIEPAETDLKAETS